MNSKVYIILPVHNRIETTKKFISCLKRQSYDNYHLLLIDDGSVDGTAEWVEKNIVKLTIIKGKGNWWWAGSLQQGYCWLKNREEISATDIVLMINDDTEFEEDFFEIALALLARQEHLLLLAQCYSLQTGELIDAGVHVDWQKFSFFQAKSVEGINCLSTRGLFMRVMDFLDTGGFFSKILPHYTSDYEFTIRARRKGMKLVTDSNLKLYCDQTTTGIHSNVGCGDLHQRIKALFSRKSAMNPFAWTIFVVLSCPMRWKIYNLCRIWYVAFRKLIFLNLSYDSDDIGDVKMDEQKTFCELPHQCLAPIVLFVFNRLEHTKRTIAALQNNELADQSELFVFADGSKESATSVDVKTVREYLKTVNGFKSVSIIEREGNWGLARNIIDGVTSIINEHGKIIVLEDDLVSSKYFLRYVNDALRTYQNEHKVMQVSGYCFPIEVEGLSETFFLRNTESWGWGTWKDRWKCFERDPERLIEKFSRDDIFRFNFEGTHDFWSQVHDNFTGKVYTWAVFWYASVFQRGGIVVYPRKSMVNNIGHDGSGEHCNKNCLYDVEIADEPVLDFSMDICENYDVNNRVINYFESIRQPAWKRALKKLRMQLTKSICCNGND
ncbi:MAG: glycosyltransferase [Bacillota bacterium]